MPTENTMRDSIRKAAILVSVLDRDCADALLDKMGPDQAARVRDAVFELETISEQEQDEIVREFVAAGGGQVAPVSQDRFRQPHVRDSDGGTVPVPWDAAAPEHEATPQFADPTPAAPASHLPDIADPPTSHAAMAAAGPFPILREASVETLANHLVHENPQVIAVVVAHLPPRRAAELIARLAPPQQADVLRRVAALDAASPAAIEILQQQLEAKLTQEIQAQRNRAVGLAAVNSILNAAGGKRDELLSNLQQNDQPLSQLVAIAHPAPAPRDGERSEPRIAAVQTQPPANAVAEPLHAARPSPASGPSREVHDVLPVAAAASNGRTVATKSRTVAQAEPVDFEQLVALDDRGLALLFRELDPEITLLALAGASPEFVQRVMRPLSPREARTLRRKMERLGPIRLSDIAAAQRAVARVATQMVNDGRLPRLVTPRFAVAA